MVPCIRALEDIVPGTMCPVQYSEEEREDLEAQHAVWMWCQELVGDLDSEFNLGEFGHVESDRDFEKVRAAAEQKKLEHVAQGKDNEVKTLLALVWPYRNMLHDSEVIPPLKLS
ncbi:hypothetical protein BU15DRAFT_69176 [Melanogaster broomeanus]|nr:hypothetical protein BU15DRAFT_69176 [Melanogaster broomeanus]